MQEELAELSFLSSPLSRQRRLGELCCLPKLQSLTLPLYLPDNTGIKITRLHLQRDKSEVCLLCLSGQWDSSTNGAVWT